MITKKSRLQRVRENLAEIERSLGHSNLPVLVEPCLVELIELVHAGDDSERTTAQKMLTTFQEMIYQRVRLIDDDKPTDISPKNLMNIVRMFKEYELIDLVSLQTMETSIRNEL